MIVDSKKAQKRKRGVQKKVLGTYYPSQLKGFKQWLTHLGYATSTIKGYVNNLECFFYYLQTQSITTIYQITPTNITHYNSWLHKQGIGSSYIKSKLRSITFFSMYYEKSYHYKFVFDKQYVEQTLSITRSILSPLEINELFNALGNSSMDMCNKALLHLCYSCGLRAGEASRVKCSDIDYQKQLLYVVPGKNYKGRYLPISNRIAKDLQAYELYARNSLNANGKYFLVSTHSDGMSNNIINRRLKELLKKTSITKPVTPHILRHSIATHLLQKGMELESIQQFLGHKTLASTQIYVHISNDYLL